MRSAFRTARRLCNRRSSTTPIAGQVVQTSQLNDARAAHTATLLGSGRVLVIGGGGNQSVQEVPARGRRGNRSRGRRNCVG